MVFVRMVLLEVIYVPEVDYFDIVLFGFFGLGIMINFIISIVVCISIYRNQFIFKRFLVTPFPIWKFFVGEIMVYLFLALFQVGIILVVGVFVFGVHIEGNVGWVLVIIVFGSVVFLNIGFIFLVWVCSLVGVSGMGNVVVLFMMFFVGTFFFMVFFFWVLSYIVQVLLFILMLEALWEVVNEDVFLWDIWFYLAVLGGWVVVTVVVAICFFRFS